MFRNLVNYQSEKKANYFAKIEIGILILCQNVILLVTKFLLLAQRVSS